MLRIVGRKIILTRGDSASLSVKIKNTDGSLYIKDDDDIVVFTLKKSTLDKNYILQKEMDENFEIELLPSDTSELGFGRYVYDVQLNKSDNSIYTVIPPSEFIIAGEVNY